MNNLILKAVYDISFVRDTVHRRTLSILVDNEFGVLARVVGLFSGHGYNIENLTVAEIEHDTKRSRITIVTSGTEDKIEQIKRQLEKMVPVYKVSDCMMEGPHIERELALVKVSAVDHARAEAIKIADIFTARIVDAKPDALIFQVTGGPKKINQFIALMMPLGLADVSRTGITAMRRDS